MTDEQTFTLYRCRRVLYTRIARSIPALGERAQGRGQVREPLAWLAVRAGGEAGPRHGAQKARLVDPIVRRSSFVDIGSSILATPSVCSPAHTAGLWLRGCGSEYSGAMN